jgi:hypothetical protein
LLGDHPVDTAIDQSGNGSDAPRVVLHRVGNGFDIASSIVLG